MGNTCSDTFFTSLNLYCNIELVAQLHEHPERLCVPKPASMFGLNDSVLHLAAELKLVEAARHVFNFLAEADQAVVEAALLPYCRRRRLPLPASSPEAARLAANLENNKGQTPLMYACYSGCPEMVKLLLEKGANPWVGDNCGCRNALHYAAMAGSASCVEALMKNIMPHMLERQGVRYVNSRSLSGLTPLHYCIVFQHQAVLQKLLQYEPNINAASTSESYDTNGFYDIYSTPLHFAAYQNSAPLAKLLLLHYAQHRRMGTLLDPRMRANSAGKLPWQVALSGALAAMLHPAVSLAEVLGQEGEEALLGLEAGDQVARGPPTLAALAGGALRQKLLAEVEVIERECVEEAALQRQQTQRAVGLLSCSTPRRSTVASTAAPNCNTGTASLFRLASCGISRSRSRINSTGMPASPRRAPTLDRMVHPTDLQSAIAAAGFKDGGASSGHQSLQQRSRGSPSLTGHSSANARGWPSKPPSSRLGGRQQLGQQAQVWNTSGFLSGAGGGGGGGASGLMFASWHPASGQPAPTNLTGGQLNLSSVSLTAGNKQPFTNGGGSEAMHNMIPTLPGGASPTSPYIPRPPADGPSGAVTPIGGSPIRGSHSSALIPQGASCGGGAGGAADDGNRLTIASTGGNLLSPATSLVAGSCTDFDTAAAAVARAAAGAIDECAGSEEEPGSGATHAMGNSEDDGDDGTCNVCFARPEAVMSRVCRHGLCAACAGELCRALVTKPLLCPFCRRPVGTFVRMVKPPAGQRR